VTAESGPGARDQAPRRGLAYEDFEVGRRFVSAARTVTEADVTIFAGLSGDYNPLHTDETSAATTPFGGRIAHRLLVVAIASGLANRLGIFEGTTVALVEQLIRYRGAVHFGDTVHLELEVESKRETKKPTRGVVEFLTEVKTADGAAVVDGKWTLLMLRRSALEAKESPDGR